MRKEDFISKEELYELYVNQRISTKKIGEKHGKHREAVRKLLIKYNIPRRDYVESWQIRKENGEIVSEEGKKRRSEGNRGNKWAVGHGRPISPSGKVNPYTISEEGRKKKAEFMKSNQYGYRGGRVPHYTNTKELRENRLVVLEKNNYKCEYCKKYTKQIHHLDLSTWNHAIDNLMPLCISCHRKLHYHTYRTYLEPYGLDMNNVTEYPPISLEPELMQEAILR
jgi:5-methylcytosine-specific restriction endonuclease McrA